MLSTKVAITPTFSERRFDRSSWITLAVGLVTLTLGVMVTVASYGIPADGWMVYTGDSARYENPVYVTSLPGANPNLQPGDMLLEVDGVPFELLESRAATLNPERPANWELGETVRYTILRDGLETSVPITLQRPPLALLYRPSVLLDNLSSLTVFVYVLLGVLLFLLRPRLRAAQLLFLLAIAFFVDDLTTWGAGVPRGIANLFAVETYWPTIIMGFMLWILLIWPALAHLFLVFPVPKRAVSRFPLITALFYIAAAVACLLFILASVLGYDVRFGTISILFVIPFFSIILLSLVHSFLKVKEPVARMQVRWIVFGGLVGILGYSIVGFGELVVNWARDAGSGSQGGFWLSLVLLLLSMALPISIAIAVLRYRLWDIEIIINRSLVYGTLTGALALIYFGSVLLLENLFRALTGQSSPIVIVISTLVIAGLFSPLRSRVQRFIDRRLYRRKYNAEQIMGRFAASVRDETDLDRLTAELQRVSMRAMQAEHVSIWLKNPGDEV
jgi:hypothetical protein